LSKGINRVTWDLRYSPLEPIKMVEETPDAWTETGQSPLAMPGTYKVSLSKRANGVVTELAAPQTFTAAPLGIATLASVDRKALFEFQRMVAELQRAVLGASRAVDDVKDQIAHIKKALLNTPAPTAKLRADVDALETRANDIIRSLRGDRTLSSRNEPAPPSIVDRVNGIVDDQWQSTGAPTQTQVDACNVAGDEFAPVLAKLRTLVEIDLKGIELGMENIGAPWTPGRVPEWKK